MRAFAGRSFGAYLFWGKPSSMPPWLGSSQRLVIALPRVKKCTPSMPWAWASPNSEAFQPPAVVGHQYRDGHVDADHADLDLVWNRRAAPSLVKMAVPLP